jgi:mono/diheme cytochrome c family protein
MRQRRLIASPTALALLAACALAHASDKVARPDLIYQRNCAACHGEKGDGESRARRSLAREPRNFTTAKARDDLPRDYMIAIVRDGLYEAPMVGRKSRLSQAEIEAVVDFIRTTFMPPLPARKD